MSQSLYKRACDFFESLAKFPESQRELARFDQIIQFTIHDEEPFFIEVSKGKISPGRGGAKREIKTVREFMTVLLVRTDSETLGALLDKSITLGEALLEGKVDIYGNIQKEYIIAWLSRLFLRT